MIDKVKLGSETAKSGFRNEVLIVEMFNNYLSDKTAQSWLEYMGYDISMINNLKTYVIPAGTKNVENLVSSSELEKFLEFHKYSKADLQVQIELEVNGIIYRENVSAKSCKENASFNQIDKRSVSRYQEMWNFNDNIKQILECFTGESNPLDFGYSVDETIVSKERHRITSKTMKKDHLDSVLTFLNENKYLILTDIVIGRGPLKADYMIITVDGIKFNIVKTSDVVNHYSRYDFEVGKQTTFKLGNCFSIQRKGGTPDPTSLQFKFNPTDVVDKLV